MIKRGVIVILFLFLLVQSVSAISVSPSKTIVFFTGDSLEENLSVSLKNKHNYEVVGEILLQDKGVPLEYINYQSTNLTFEPNERKDIDFGITIPEKFDEPGDYRFDFIVRELSPPKEEGGMFGVSIAVGGIFLVRVPYEGYYMGARLEADGVTVGEEVPFKLTLENIGTMPIENIQGTLEIFDNSSEKVGEVPFTYSLPINSLEVVDLKWDSSEASYGNYYAVATMNFKSKSIKAETDFKLGDMFVDIVNFDKIIRSGIINKYKVKIKSEWGNPIDNIFMKLEVSPGISPKIFKSENFNLDSWESKEVIIYVDTEEIKGGTYPAKISAFYEGIHTEKEFDLRISSFDYISVGVGVGIFIIVFVIGYFIMFKRSKKSKDGKK
jgi:hypothetical protein